MNNDDTDCPECGGFGDYLPAGACGACEFCPSPRVCGACKGTGRIAVEPCENDDGCGCSDADGPCPRHEVDEEGPRGSEAADAIRDSQAAAQRSR